MGKPCLKPGCKYPRWGGGYCLYDQYLREKKPKPLKNKLPAPKAKDKEYKDALEVFFQHHISRCTHSENSGVAIPYPDKVNIAHIMPKATYKSVACNLDNCIYLTWQEHQDFDTMLFKHQFDQIKERMPNTWKLVVQRFMKLLPQIAENKRLKLALEAFLFGK